MSKSAIRAGDRAFAKVGRNRRNGYRFVRRDARLFGKPGTVDTFEIGYLKGRRTPTVERGDLDFNVLGVWFRVYFDVGIREQDHRGMVKSNGAAG